MIRLVASSGSRRRVDDFRNSLASSDRLSDSQTEQLIATLHAQQTQFRKEVEQRMESLRGSEDGEAIAREMTEFYKQRMQAAHERVGPAAAAFLTPAQLARFEEMVRRERLNDEAQQTLSRLHSQLEPPESTD